MYLKNLLGEGSVHHQEGVAQEYGKEETTGINEYENIISVQKQKPGAAEW